MLKDDKNQLMIFCDGGIGNRINSLISGLAIARHFKLAFCVYWPENNWCQASFGDIFKNQLPTSKLSISNLSKKLGGAIVLLHDDIASKSLEVEFNSAYQYSSMQDFADKVLNAEKNIFYYPAVMPQWIPLDLCLLELKSLAFTDYIAQSVIDFVNGMLKAPFHGLHLRRTDLNVGLNDHEVINLVRRHPTETFFVCSDDPEAEGIASAHSNVVMRTKTSHVDKKNSANGWLAQSTDDDGRVYYGNIQRGKDAVIEGVIDMLILAQSQIAGYSGSTFQRMARLIGENCPLLPLKKPDSLNYIIPSEIHRQLEAGSLSVSVLIAACNKIGIQGDFQEAISLLQKGCNHFENNDYLDLLHTLGVIHLNQRQNKIAKIYLKEVTSLDPNRYSSLLHLALANLLLAHIPEAQENLIQSEQCKPSILSENDHQVLIFLTQNLLKQNFDGEQANAY